MAEYDEEENLFADIDEYIEDTNAIVPLRVDAATFKVEHGLILMLKAEGFFRNSTDDDPTQHHRNFLGVCAMHKQNNVSDDALRLMVFKYSLVGEARKWIQNLPPHSIHSWPELVHAFLAKWFPQRRKSELKDKIFFFKQLPGEHLHEAWDWFKQYLVRLPNHGFPDKIMSEKFYMGLDPLNQSIAKNVADGSFMDKTFTRITQILGKMAEYNQAWHSENTMGGIAYGTPSLTNMIKENQERDQVIIGLATNINVLTKMFTENQTKKVNNVEDVQPWSTEDYEEANYVHNSQGGYLQQNQWRPNPQGQGHQQWRNDQGGSSQGENEQIIGVDDLEQEVEAQVEVQVVVEVEKLPKSVKVQEENHEKVKRKEAPTSLAQIPRPSPPFPQRLARRVDDSKFEKFYDILKQLSVNIPFVEAFQEMSGFAKYLKDLITKKRTTKNDVTHRVSPIIATTIVEKKEHPGAFTIPCTIGLRDFARALSSGVKHVETYKHEIANGRSFNQKTSGIIDDVLVKVEKFLFSDDFVILDCAVDKEIPIFLGRPFFATGTALMDSERNKIKFRVNDEEVTFQERRGMKLPYAYEGISVIDVVDEVEDSSEMKMEEECLGEALAEILVNGENMEGYMESMNALEGRESYTYAPKKLSLDLENRAIPPAKP
ncbi:uncharacterized protein LOC107765855 [Nicotiana tabacum]|uniref:Uncharacterized protein LOC107765855 n=1 Tax=Nicotiana tabacum TaxID=4097 RepID=A0AC58TKZ5_TOBAC